MDDVIPAECEGSTDTMETMKESNEQLNEGESTRRLSVSNTSDEFSTDKIVRCVPRKTLQENLRDKDKPKNISKLLKIKFEKANNLSNVRSGIIHEGDNNTERSKVGGKDSALSAVSLYDLLLQTFSSIVTNITSIIGEELPNRDNIKLN